MTRFLIVLAAAGSAVAGLLVPGPAVAQWTSGETAFALLPPSPMLRPAGPPCHELARRAVMAGQAIPFARIKVGVENQFGGKVVDFDCTVNQRGLVYHLKLIGPGGRVQWVTLNPRDGRVLGVRG